MRKESSKNGVGKVVAKQDLPSKVCVVCHRPFTWRKKWERVWDEVTTCSKSCNAKRKALAKQGKTILEASNTPTLTDLQSTESSSTTEDEARDNQTGDFTVLEDPVLAKKMLRKQQKEAVKAQKRERRAKREGNASPDVGRKPCD